LIVAGDGTCPISNTENWCDSNSVLWTNVFSAIAMPEMRKNRLTQRIKEDA